MATAHLLCFEKVLDMTAMFGNSGIPLLRKR